VFSKSCWGKSQIEFTSVTGTVLVSELHIGEKNEFLGFRAWSAIHTVVRAGVMPLDTGQKPALSLSAFAQSTTRLKPPNYPFGHVFCGCSCCSQ
jgi:hypothetical protein